MAGGCKKGDTAEDLLRERIAESPYTYDELAKMCGVSRRTVFNVTRDDGVSHARFGFVARLCELVGVSVVDLMVLSGRAVPAKASPEKPLGGLDRLRFDYLYLGEYDKDLLLDFADMLMARCFGKKAA